ncbi:hypothetical protein K1T71_001145 [Dendrolimus kikuchii]|uniref:Uncharacterized protein n=1 Tax=Dendrolimus kikuchii TaxID=765133 RepID=A0ACC1DGQ6_9NEOP|nr:hypothetical protein K1T71_001145 [Dendrolimus kikuchii]
MKFFLCVQVGRSTSSSDRHGQTVRCITRGKLGMLTEVTPDSKDVNIKKNETCYNSKENISNLLLSKRQRKGSDDQLTIFKDEIREMLDEWKESQNSILNKLVSEVVEIKRQNNEIKNSNQEIEKALEFINAQYEDMKQKVESLEKERNDQKVQIAVLESKLEDMQRVSKASMIEIRNLPIINKPETKGDLSNIVQNTCKALNLVVPQTAIRDVYRLYGKTGKGTIIADFNSVMVKNEVLQGLKAYNKIHSNKRLTSSAIGLPGEDIPIYISESLSSRGRRLFYLARDFAKTQGYKFCWTNNGRIYLRETTESTHLEIKNEIQLHSLKSPQ